MVLLLLLLLSIFGDTRAPVIYESNWLHVVVFTSFQIVLSKAWKQRVASFHFFSSVLLLRCVSPSWTGGARVNRHTGYRPGEFGKTVSGFYGFDFEGGGDRPREIDDTWIRIQFSFLAHVVVETTTGDALIVALPRYNLSRMFVALKRVCSWSIWKLSGYLCARWIFIDVPYRRCNNIERDRCVFGRVNRERKVGKKKRKK